MKRRDILVGAAMLGAPVVAS
ncbi:MAG: hypothetical protein JWO26_1176, partial [Rhodospirillales bacterium]|nr:hypothetical protein [Rhodospirillales bacterium]